MSKETKRLGITVVAILVLIAAGAAAYVAVVSNQDTDSTINNNTNDGAPNVTTNSNANTSNMLLTIESHGGLCVYGACGSDITIASTGAYVYTRGDGQTARGTLASVQLNDLRERIQSADFDAIKSKPFTETCPIAYDGQEFMYTFPSMDETIATCTVAIDETMPLFTLITQIREMIYAQPTAATNGNVNVNGNTNNDTNGATACFTAGCSGQLCVDESGKDVFTTCEFRAEYACYRNARCERQTNGDCGWTMTDELRSCIANPPSIQ